MSSRRQLGAYDRQGGNRLTRRIPDSTMTPAVLCKNGASESIWTDLRYQRYAITRLGSMRKDGSERPFLRAADPQ
jgi:hypothetical protein